MTILPFETRARSTPDPAPVTPKVFDENFCRPRPDDPAATQGQGPSAASIPARLLAGADPDLLRWTLDALSPNALMGLRYHFPFWAMPHQLPPPRATGGPG